LGRGIGLVGDEDELCVGVGVAFDLVDPVVLDVLEAVATGEVEDEEDGVGVWVGGGVLL
jgi:hypothetical protein